MKRTKNVRKKKAIAKAIFANEKSTAKSFKARKLFERAKMQIKVETEGEEKINNSYQSIYKQLIEIIGAIGVLPVETIGKPFDPMLHEAIMREDSAEFEEGIILEEFRKGFKLGDRLLRPAMVKVSAGPGPAKPKEEQPAKEGEVEATESSEAEAEADST